MDRAVGYREAVMRRRAFSLPGYQTLADEGFDGEYVSPIQLTSGNVNGPMLITKDWFDVPSARANRDLLLRKGFMPGIPFNRVLDLALNMACLKRGDVYITPAFALLTPRRSHSIPIGDCRASFEAVGQYELLGRRPVACGSAAAMVLRGIGVPHIETLHPSARGHSFEERARRIANALEAA